jgi:hypothetical protein
MAGRARIEASEEAVASIAVELIAVLVAVADARPLAMTIDGGRALRGRSRPGAGRGNRPCAPGSSARPAVRLGMSRSSTPSPTAIGAAGRMARGRFRSAISDCRAERAQAPHAGRRPWYDYLPWEDHRFGALELIARTIAPVCACEHRRG